MTSLLIRGAACVVTMDDAGSEHRNIDIRIESGEITELGQELEASGPVMDARGCLVTPGLVNTHHHLFQTLTRAVPAAQDAALFGWLQTLYPIWARFTPEHMFVSAQAGLAELALSGCTMTSDHLYLFPGGSRLDDTIAAAGEIGLRFHARAGPCRSGKPMAGCHPTALWRMKNTS